MGIEDIVNQGKEALSNATEAVAGVLKSEKAEEISDKVLDGAAGFAKKVAPAAADQIDGVRDTIDKAVGAE